MGTDRFIYPASFTLRRVPLPSPSKKNTSTINLSCSPTHTSASQPPTQSVNTKNRHPLSPTPSKYIPRPYHPIEPSREHTPLYTSTMPYRFDCPNLKPPLSSFQQPTSIHSSRKNARKHTTSATVATSVDNCCRAGRSVSFNFSGPHRSFRLV